MVVRRLMGWARRRRHAKRLARLALSRYEQTKPIAQKKAAGAARVMRTKGSKLAHEATSDTLKLAEAALREAEKKLEAARKQLGEVETETASKRRTMPKTRKKSVKKPKKKVSQKQKSSRKRRTSKGRKSRKKK